MTRKPNLDLGARSFRDQASFLCAGPEDRLAFASEIRALLEFPGIDLRPDRQAIYDFAALFFIPAPETFYTGIRALQPGEILEAQLGTTLSIFVKHANYHRWAIAPDPAMTLAQAADRADALLTAAVQPAIGK